MLAATRVMRGFAAMLALLALTGCFQKQPWHDTDISGALPPLAFTMTRANDGKRVSAADYRGKVVILAFGYTNCPDICPTTLANLSVVLGDLGTRAEDVRVLFVTVDPNRDTQSLLAKYVGYFAPQIDGLRGSSDALAALAKRYRLLYSVSPKTATHAYEVTHGAAVYVFDRKGDARLLVTSLFTAKPDIKGLTADVRRLLDGGASGGVWHRLSKLFG